MRLVRLFLLLILVALVGCGGDNGGGGTPSGAPQIVSFTANPTNLAAAGQPVTLSWDITGSVTGLEIDNGIGSVSGTSTIVYPTATTTYTLTASNGSGEASLTTNVTLGSGAGPGADDGAAPTGTFGVSLTQDNFQSDQDGNITSASDPRIVLVTPNSTFYALVSYSDPGGISAVRLRLANSSPAGFAQDLVQGQDINGFTLNGEVTGCALDGTQVAVTCIYEIAVGDIGNIDTLPGVSGEFAYVLRTNVIDSAGTESDSPPRGYVIIDGSGNGGGGGGGGTTPNRAPTADFTFQQQANTLIVAFDGASSSDPDGDNLKYSWDFGDGSTAATRDYRKTFSSAGNKTVKLTVSDPDGESNTSTKTVQVVAPSGGGGGNPVPAAPNSNSFTATPASITSGQRSTLSWNVTGANAINISPDVGDLNGKTSIAVSPQTTTTYTLTAVGNGRTDTATATITVGNGETPPPPPPPTISSFSASPAEIDAGDSATLLWSVSGATSLSISPGVGSVTGTSTNVSPDSSTEYTLTAMNDAGSVSARTTISVREPQQETDETRTRSLLGRWVFSYSIGGGGFTDTYNLTSVVELSDGDFVAVGTDQYGIDVIAGYDPETFDRDYFLYASSPDEVTGIDQTFVFNYTSQNAVAGYTYLYDIFEDDFSDDYPFSGTRTGQSSAVNSLHKSIDVRKLERIQALYEEASGNTR